MLGGEGGRPTDGITLLMAVRHPSCVELFAILVMRDGGIDEMMEEQVACARIVTLSRYEFNTATHYGSSAARETRTFLM